MDFVSPNRVPWLLAVAALLLLLAAAVDCGPRNSSYVRHRMIHKSRRSTFAKLWNKLGKPFRTIHSAHTLLLGPPKNKGNGTFRKSSPKSQSPRTTTSAYTTSFPARFPATPFPGGGASGDETPSTNPLPVDACAAAASESDSALVTWNLQRLRSSECGWIEPRILEGDDAMPGEFPWLAIIKAESYYFRGEFMAVCGGSLINERYVLTAAHCVRDSRYIVTSVVLGEYDTETWEDDCSSIESLFVAVVNGGVCRTDPPVEIKVDCIVLHPGFKYSASFPDDIALIRLRDPVEFSAYISPICLPLGDFDVRINEDLDLGNNLTVAGWGMTMNESRSSKPMKADIPLMDFTACKTYVSDIPQGKLCVGDVIGGTPCPGDSGGPLFTKKTTREPNEMEEDRKRTPRAVQVGIVSAGPRYCEFRQPTLFTNVQDYLLWLLGNMKP